MPHSYYKRFRRDTPVFFHTFLSSGHTRAAGCELLGNLDNAKSAILAEVEAELDRPETQEES